MRMSTEDEQPPPPYSSLANPEHQQSLSSSSLLRSSYGNRPKNLWKICIPSQYDLWPFSPLKQVYWCLEKETEIEYEISFEPLSKGIGGLVKKFGCYRGKAGFSDPFFTYTPLTNTLKSTETDLTIKCNYAVNKKDGNQSLTFAYQEIQYKWISNRIMSTVRGNSWDMANSILLNQNGIQLASFAWLLPDGNLDACIRPTSEKTVTTIHHEILLLTFTLLYYHQFQTMYEELCRSVRLDRIITLEKVRANLTPGRMVLYSAQTVEELNGHIKDEERQWQRDCAAEQARKERMGESTSSM